MNPDKPSREQIEARITALLLGELPADEAELLRWTISQDPELQKLHARLLLTVGLVREALAHPADADEKSAPMKLSDERREKLLEHFKTPQPQPLVPPLTPESFWRKQMKMSSLVSMLVLLAIVALLASMVMPALSRAKRKAQMITNLSGDLEPVYNNPGDGTGGEVTSTPAHRLPDGGGTINQTVGTAAITPPPAAPTVAPTPPTEIAEIVLPKTESSTAADGINSATVVGYASVPNNSSAPSATPADSFATGNAGGGGAGGGGGDVYVVKSGDTLTKIARERGTTVQALQAANNLSTTKIRAGEKMKMPAEAEATAPAPQIQTPALAWDDSGVTSSTDLNAPQNPGEDYRRNVPAGTAAPAFTFSAESTVASTAPVNKKDSDQDGSLYLGAKQAEAKPSPDTSNDRIVAQRNLQAQPSRTATIAESEQVPVLGDVPVTGTMFQQRLVNIENKATNPTGAFSENVTHNSFDTAAPAAMPASPSTAGGDVMLEFSGKGESTKSDNGTLTLNGNNSFAGGTTINAGTRDDLGLLLARASTNDVAMNLYSGVTRDDANGLRYLLRTNTVALADSERQKAAQTTADQIVQSGLRESMVTAPKPLEEDKALLVAALPPPISQPEVLCRENNFSTFSLNVSDVSFKLAAASLEKGRMPDAGSIRSEEFINAFDYRDPEAAAGQPLAFAAERARYPFAHNRDLLRFSVKTAAAGRPAGRALNLVLLLDNSGSMERADRVAIIREALRVLATQLQPQDTVSVVTFARTARLWADGVSGDKAGETLKNVGGITPDGGTNLEEAMRLAYETARRHYLANGMNRVVLLTDGAANLGDVSPTDLKQKVEAQRKQGIALDCFGIGFEDFNDDLLEQLSSNGDGRYAFLNSPEDASKEFASKLAGALQVAAQDVKVQVEFNPQRVISWRQIGYAKHQLTKEQFRDNTVDAAEIAAQEAGNALYTVETKPDGIGPIATVRVRYKVPGTTDYRERSWNVDYTAAPALEQSSPAMRLAATASAFSEWLAASPFAQEVTPDELQRILTGVPQVYGADERPKKLETMLREAKSISGK